MPNYVTNIISLHGESKQIKQLVDQIAFEGKPGTFDFNKVVPMPMSLDLTEGTIKENAVNAYISATNPGNRSDLSPVGKLKLSDHALLYVEAKKALRFGLPNTRLTDSEIKELAQRHKLSSPEALVALGKQYVDNVREHGASTWYDWRISVKNWGTKWNNEPDDLIVDERDSSLRLLTAWSAPIPIVEELSRQHPELSLSISWADEDLGQNVGQATFQNGALIYEYMPEPGSKEALELACSIQGISFEKALEDYLPELAESNLDDLVSEAKDRAQVKQQDLRNDRHEPNKNDPER